MKTTPHTANQDGNAENPAAAVADQEAASGPPQPPDNQPQYDDEPPYDEEPRDEQWEDEPENAEFLPPRPRGRLLRPMTILLFAALMASTGFLGGVVMEKHQLPSTAAATGTRSPTGTGGRSANLGGASATGGANAVAGQVSTVSGGTLYVTDSSGNTIEVTTSAASQITKTATASVHSVHPGDTVVIQGAVGANGTIAATAVRDSGTGSAAGAFGGRGSTSTGAGSSTAGSSSSTTGSNAGGSGGVNSLFGG
jgi:hypothetical protein